MATEDADLVKYVERLGDFMSDFFEHTRRQQEAAEKNKTPPPPFIRTVEDLEMMIMVRLLLDENC